MKETSTTIGTGTLNLDGAVSKFVGFVAAIGTGNPCYYAIVHQSAAEWEVGIGTVTDAAPDTLSRTTVLASSNAGALVNFSAGTKDVFVTLPAAYVGYRNIPQLSKSAAYTTVLADSGYHILHPTADNIARTFTIDSNANVAYAIGTAITFVNQINTVTIAITTDTMTFLPGGGTGSRTLAANGIATALKVSTTGWIITGSGLT